MGRVGGYLRWLLLGVITCFQGARGIRLMEVRIPMYAMRDQIAILECDFDMEGESLHSVKWYKDGNEFYRYLPGDKPPAQVFPLSGVTVDIDISTESTVVLSSVNLLSTGRYRCEVSGEVSSLLVSGQGDMIVVARPVDGPRISGGRPRYQVGDTVRVNCTSGLSKPAAQLIWFINGVQADASFVSGPFRWSDREGLVTSTLGLEFKVRPKHFRRNGVMKLKCLATISPVYWRSIEESVEGDRPQKAPTLETHKLQGNSTVEASASASTSGEFGADSNGSEGVNTPQGTATRFTAMLINYNFMLLLLQTANSIFIPLTASLLYLTS